MRVYYRKHGTKDNGSDTIYDAQQTISEPPLK